LIPGQVVGLLAVVIGAAIAVSVRLVLRVLRKPGHREQLVKEECAKLLFLSEDLQRRILAQQRGSGMAADVPSSDAGAYRRAWMRLQNLRPPAPVQAALTELDETRTDLRLAWQLSASQPSANPRSLAYAIDAHAEAIEHFATSASVLIRVSWPSGASSEVA
jgi:hypothetical protein